MDSSQLHLLHGSMSSYNFPFSLFPIINQLNVTENYFWANKSFFFLVNIQLKSSEHLTGANKFYIENTCIMSRECVSECERVELKGESL